MLLCNDLHFRHTSFQRNSHCCNRWLQMEMRSNIGLQKGMEMVQVRVQDQATDQ